MIPRQQQPRQNTFERRKVKTPWLHKSFQLKYSLIFAGTVLLCMAVFIIPIYYTTLQNQNIFQNLAYRTAPELVSHLEQEIKWLNFFIFITTIGIMTFISFLSIKITARLSRPILLLENHLKKMATGSWAHDLIRIRKDDEFYELIQYYNHFHQTLQNITRKDLQYIQSLNISKNDVTSLEIQERLIKEKQALLGQQPFNITDSSLSHIAKVS